MSGEWIVLPFTLSVAERSRRASGPTAMSLLRKNVTPYPGSSPGQTLIRGWSPGGLDSGSSPECRLGRQTLVRERALTSGGEGQGTDGGEEGHRFFAFFVFS